MSPGGTHFAFDAAAWSLAALTGAVTRKRFAALAGRAPRVCHQPNYYTALCLGAAAGAVLFGSLNLSLAGPPKPGHSIAGAMAGGIVAVEAYKWARGIRGSTGLPFVLPLAVGIAVGRLGCFFSGLVDETYGIASTTPWAVDFGDGVARHPVQIYEALALVAFAVFFTRGLARNAVWLAHGFYVFVAFYAAQRFLWEFLKPYPLVLGPLNVFHLLCAALFLYAASTVRH